MIREKWALSSNYKETSTIILQDSLAALRAKAGVNQEELANIIGVSRQTYYAIETGKKVMSWNTYMSLIFFYHELNSTKDMIDELRVYPVELFMKMNDQLPPIFGWFKERVSVNERENERGKNQGIKSY